MTTATMTPYEHGYATAAGKVGTGWMRFTSTLAADGYEGFDGFGQAWMETDQCAYETQGVFQWADYNGQEELEQFIDEQERWCDGYDDFVTEQLRLRADVLETDEDTMEYQVEEG